MNTRAHWWQVGVLCLLLASTQACRGALWERYNDTGAEAYEQGFYAEAEEQWLAALEEAESFGPQDQRLTTTLKNLADLYYAQGEYSEAEPLYQRLLAVQEQALGAEHPDLAASLNDLAFLYDAQGNYAEAQPLYQRSLEIMEKALGAEHPGIVTSLDNLASLYAAQGDYAKAEPLYRRSLVIVEKAFGAEHRTVATSIENYAALLREMGREEEAAEWEARAKALRLQQAQQDQAE